MNDLTIICYLDVLGYREFVRRHYTDESIIKDIEKIFQSSVGYLKDLKQKGCFDDPVLEEYRQHVINALKIRFVSDSVIYTLDLSKVPAANADVVEGEPLKYCFHYFFRLISMFCTTFIGKTSLVVRGGITIGPHYERDWEVDGAQCLFIFSKAFVDAVDLEKKAKTARIVIGESLSRFLQAKTDVDIDEFTFKDPQGKLCLDLYNIFRACFADKAKAVLRDIKRAITLNLADSSSDLNALKKLRYFAKFHNIWVRKFLSDENLLIDYPGTIHTYFTWMLSRLTRH
ncbi:MAG: hypothetical protein Q7J31_16260 [Syntrophales bacterium]|nr:hypothetical protein [Syntrophales bacterium]